MYFDLDARTRRVHDGVCGPIQPTEIQAWIGLTRKIVYPVEYGMLAEMDDAFCRETNLELAAYRERQKAEADKNAPKGRGRRK